MARQDMAAPAHMGKMMTGAMRKTDMCLPTAMGRTATTASTPIEPSTLNAANDASPNKRNIAKTAAKTRATLPPGRASRSPSP